MFLKIFNDSKITDVSCFSIKPFEVIISVKNESIAAESLYIFSSCIEINEKKAKF